LKKRYSTDRTDGDHIAIRCCVPRQISRCAQKTKQLDVLSHIAAICTVSQMNVSILHWITTSTIPPVF